MQVCALDKPFRPWPLKAINGIGRGLDALCLELVHLDEQGLLQRAIRKSGGLSDFGPEGFREGLRRFLQSVEQESQATLIGRVMARETVIDNLVNRLQVIEWRKRHPEVAEQQVRRPLFIVGLPRTGTTILHALLAVDPANRSPLFWEVQFPVPPATPATFRSDPRIARDQASLDQMYKLCPGFQAVHPMGATMPQECVAWFTMNFMSEQLHCLFNVPSYIEWLDDADMRPTYRWHRQFLQHLQSGGVTGERWLLKSPCHLHLLHDLLAEYPDADIIHTHRDPVAVCTSIASLIAMLRGLATDRIDLPYIGRQQLDWWEKLLGRAVQQRKALQDRQAQFFDLKMSDTVADPLGSVERIYAHFGYGLAAGVKRDMERFMKDNARDKHGSHTYRPEDFGIVPARDRERFRAYCEYFGV